MDKALLVTLTIFLAGVIYNAGRLSMRIDKLEEWRTEARGDLHEIFNALRRVEGLIKGEERP